MESLNKPKSQQKCLEQRPLPTLTGQVVSEIYFILLTTKIWRLLLQHNLGFPDQCCLPLCQFRFHLDPAFQYKITSSNSQSYMLPSPPPILQRVKPKLCKKSKNLLSHEPLANVFLVFHWSTFTLMPMDFWEIQTFSLLEPTKKTKTPWGSNY